MIRYFAKEDIQIANKHMKNAQHHEPLGNANQNYNVIYFTPNRVATIKKRKENKDW